MKKQILKIILSLSLFGVSCSHSGLTPEQSAVVAGDGTAIAIACGNNPTPGAVLCRIKEGAPTSDLVTFIAPPAQCDREACAYIKVWNGHGDLAWGASIPKGQTKIIIPWKTLLGGDNGPSSFSKSDRGLWSWNLQVFFKDLQGQEQESHAMGDLLLRVYSADYLPIQNAQDDPGFNWRWSDGGYSYKVTTGLRSEVHKKEDR